MNDVCSQQACSYTMHCIRAKQTLLDHIHYDTPVWYLQVGAVYGKAGMKKEPGA